MFYGDNLNLASGDLMSIYNSIFHSSNTGLSGKCPLCDKEIHSPLLSSSSCTGKVCEPVVCENGGDCLSSLSGDIGLTCEYELSASEYTDSLLCGSVLV